MSLLLDQIGSEMNKNRHLYDVLLFFKLSTHQYEVVKKLVGKTGVVFWLDEYGLELGEDFNSNIKINIIY